MTTSTSATTAKPEALGRVTFLDGQGELPMLEISTAWSTAAIYLHGAHVTQFKKKDEPPLLFCEPVQPVRRGTTNPGRHSGGFSLVRVAGRFGPARVRPR